MEKQYKRTSRACPQNVKTALSNKLRGRTRGEQERIAISRGMKKYWENDDNFPDDGQRHDWIGTGDIV